MSAPSSPSTLFIELLQYMFAVGIIGASVVFVLFLIDELRTVISERS